MGSKVILSPFLPSTLCGPQTLHLPFFTRPVVMAKSFPSGLDFDITFSRKREDIAS